MKANHSRSRKTAKTAGVVGYVRCSTEEQAVSGLGLAAQRTAIEADCARRGLSLLAVYSDEGVSGKTLNNRPALAAALADLDAGHGTVLMVDKLDRFSRSVHDATGLLLRAERAGWGLVALDVAVDTTTPQGAAMTQVLAVFAELERWLIGESTKAALAVKRAQGVKLGRPRTFPQTSSSGSVPPVRRAAAGRAHRPRPQHRRHTDRAGRQQVASGHGPLRTSPGR